MTQACSGKKKTVGKGRQRGDQLQKKGADPRMCRKRDPHLAVMRPNACAPSGNCRNFRFPWGVGFEFADSNYIYLRWGI